MHLGHAIEDWTGAAGVGQLHVQDPDLGRLRRPDLAAERLREKLMAQAETEERHLPLDDRLADRLALGLEPGVDVVLPHVHRAAHDPERVVAAQIRNQLAFVELDRGPLDAVLAQEVPEHSGMLQRDVLEDEDSWLGCGHGIAPAVMADMR